MSDAKSILLDWRERDCIQNDLDVNLLVEAAAGTGKNDQPDRANDQSHSRR